MFFAVKPSGSVLPAWAGQTTTAPVRDLEVTLQPLRRFALDAAILFSDILVVPEALGLPYYFKEEGGIGMERRLETAADIDGLRPASAIREKLAYVPETLRRLRIELADTRALLGFSGSPWTLACYMLEGGGSDDFARAKAVFHGERVIFERLLTPRRFGAPVLAEQSV